MLFLCPNIRILPVHRKGRSQTIATDERRSALCGVGKRVGYNILLPKPLTIVSRSATIPLSSAICCRVHPNQQNSFARRSCLTLREPQCILESSQCPQIGSSSAHFSCWLRSRASMSSMMTQMTRSAVINLTRKKTRLRRLPRALRTTAKFRQNLPAADQTLSQRTGV